MADQVDKMMDFRRNVDSEMCGFTRVIARVRDVANFIVATVDMGRGVSCFWFKLPEGLTADELTTNFRTFAQTSPIFLPNNLNAENESMYEFLSLTHLGEGGYMGIYECGAADTNEYMLVVQSYDMSAASAFSESTFRRVRKHVDVAPDLEKRDQLLDKLSKAKMFLGTPAYEATMDRSRKNRLYLAANFFDAFGIQYHSEKLRIHGQEDSIAICSEQQLMGDFPCTFLKREGSSFLRLYNSAYSYSDVLNGAPWHLCMHEGLRTYHCPDKYRAEKQNKFMNGVAMGAPHLRRNPMVTEYNREDGERVNTIVAWQSVLNTMFIADPKMRIQRQVAIDKFQSAYELDMVPPRHWRALGVAILPPDMDTISLRELIAFSDTDNILVPIRAYDQIMDIWLSLHEFKRNRGAFMRDLSPEARVSIPGDYALPKISDLFINEKINTSECEMERGLLKQMIDNYDLIAAIMRRYNEGYGKPSSQPRMHEMIRREANDIPPPAPPSQPREENLFDDPNMMPIGESGSEASTGMSEMDVRTLRNTSRRREQKRSARTHPTANTPALRHAVHPDARKPETIIHKMIPQSNSFYERGETEDEGTESEYYHDLGVMSTDDDRR